MQDEPRPENRSSIRLRTSPGGRAEEEKGKKENVIFPRFIRCFSCSTNRSHVRSLHDTVNTLTTRRKLGPSNLLTSEHQCKVLIYSDKIRRFQGDEGCLKTVGCFDFTLYCLPDQAPTGVDVPSDDRRRPLRKAEICSHFGFRCKSGPEEFDQTHAVWRLYELC